MISRRQGGFYFYKVAFIFKFSKSLGKYASYTLT